MHIYTLHTCLLHVFSNFLPCLTGGKPLPCELSHHYAMQWPLQLCCHRHDSGCPAPVTPHKSDDWFFGLGKLVLWQLFAVRVRNSGVPATACLSPNLHYCTRPVLCNITTLRRPNLRVGFFQACIYPLPHPHKDFVSCPHDSLLSLSDTNPKTIHPTKTIFFQFYS